MGTYTTDFTVVYTHCNILYYKSFPDFVCFSSRRKGEMSNKTKEIYLITEMYELTKNGKPKESSFIKPRASSIRSKKDEPVDEQETDLDVEMLASIPVPSVEGWLQPHKVYFISQD